MTEEYLKEEINRLKKKIEKSPRVLMKKEFVIVEKMDRVL